MKRFFPACLGVLFAAAACFGQKQESVGIVSHVKVLSDKVEDVSSLEAWKNATLSPGMSDKEKGIAIWRSVVQHQHQNSPPNEFIHAERNVLDFLKIANVYGYSYCSVGAGEVIGLARHAGMQARGWTIKGHCVPEIFWDGKWHLLDPSLINYFPKPDGDIASVAEIMAAVKAWYEKNPGFKGNDKKLRAYGREQGGWRWKQGPKLLAECPFYGIRGWLPAKTHGWYSTMQEYDGTTLFRYESGYSQGYQVNVQLRPGMRLVRNWSNKGLYANMDKTGGKPGCINGTIGKGDLVHCPGFGDLAPGRVGNGTLEYRVPVTRPRLADSVLVFENLRHFWPSPPPPGSWATKPAPYLTNKDQDKPGVLVLGMPTSYVYLTGKLEIGAGVHVGEKIVVSVSLNNGLDWTEIATIEKTGTETVDFSRLVLRRYDYRLKIEVTGARLVGLRITHDVQHSQRPLPALTEGTNTITFSTGPPEGTVTIEASANLKNRGKALVFTDFHPRMQNIARGRLMLTGNTGHVTFPIETPGDMTRLRFGCFYWAGRANAGWDLQVSFDDGKTFKTAKPFGKSVKRNARWTTFSDVPPKTRKALVRYAGTGKGNTNLMSFRIDADYTEPHGGFRPVKVTYLWTEEGEEKRDVHVAKSPAETYTITCAKRPVMKSLIVELAD